MKIKYWLGLACVLAVSACPQEKSASGSGNETGGASGSGASGSGQPAGSGSGAANLSGSGSAGGCPVMCGDHAHCTQAGTCACDTGYVGGANGTCVVASGLCQGVTCAQFASCNPNNGACSCIAGYRPLGDLCVSSAAPSARSKEEVCRVWKAAHVERATTHGWQSGTNACDPGTLSSASKADALLRLNMFRWLAGLDSVVEDTALSTANQQCALLMATNAPPLLHNPPNTWTCYAALPQGVTSAGPSNLATAVRAAASVDFLMIDRVETSSGAGAGHRGWFLRRPLGKVGVGFARLSTRAFGASCFDVQSDSTGASSTAWSGYPSPGPFPVSLVPSGTSPLGGAVTVPWTFYHYSGQSHSSATVTVTRQPEGTSIPITVHPATNFVYWHLDASVRPAAGERYRIRIDNLPQGPVEYDTELVQCN